MIAPASAVMWACPHCAHSNPRDPISDDRFCQCQHCQFWFPSTEFDGDVEIPLEGLDETWSEKWGPIRTDRYHVLRILATGAQGKILLAHHRHLDERCVIKLVAADDELSAEVATQRLKNEARAGVRVNHINVARVFDCDCVDKAWYFVMEYVPGENLRKIVQRVQCLSPEQVVNIGSQTAAGLAAIHRSGLIHRDIKPSNLMLTCDGTVKIMDLGLVKLPIGSGSLGVTHVGQVLGTPLYMPPEQFDATEHIDARADIYALGATLFHCLTGRPPFNGTSIEHIAREHRSGPIVWTDEESQRIPQWLRDAVEGCMAKRREHRIESAEAVARALREHDGEAHRVALVERPRSRGVTVLAFKNLSRMESDEWIGDAIAEYLSSRLMACEGVHVADRNVVADLMRQTAGQPDADPSRTQLFAAARLAGVTHVVTGSYQRHGDDLRIIAQLQCREESETRLLATVSGPIASLFELEDELSERTIASIGPTLSAAIRRRTGAGATSNLEAHEKYIHGRRAFVDGDFTKAIEFAEQARALDPEYHDPPSLIGACYARLGEYDRALEYHQRQERMARAAGDDAELAVALGNLGATYYYKGEYALAFEFLQRAAPLSLEVNSSPDTAKLFGNLGMVLIRLERLEDAEEALEKAIDLCREFRDVVSMVWPYNGMGSVLLKQGRFAEAREFHERALTLAEEVGDRVMMGISQMNIGRCACLLGEFEEAEIRFNAALGILERTNFWNGLTLVYEYMAEMYLLQNKPDGALASNEKQIELANRHGNARMESQAWEQRARAFELMRRGDDALKALKKSIEVSQRPAPYESLHRYLDALTKRNPLR